MTPEELMASFEECLEAGMIEKVGLNAQSMQMYRLTDAGLSYVEDVLLAEVEDSMRVYALGILQGQKR